MNLGDAMTRLADDADVRLMPAAREVRRRGDRLRAIRRRRTVAAVVVAAVVATGAAASLVPRPTGSGPEPAGPVDGWREVRTVEVPGTGTTFAGGGSIWVVDGEGDTLYQVDPASGDVLDRVQGVSGGWPSVGAGALWLSDVGRETLTRVDLSDHAVTHVAVTEPSRHPQGSVVAGGNLWVILNATGDLLRLDPATGRVRRTIHLGAYADGEAPRSVVSDGVSLWVSDDDGLVQRFDATDGRRLGRLQTPLRDLLLDGIDTGRRVLYAHRLGGSTLIEVDLDQRGSRWQGRELSWSTRPDSALLGLAVAPEALWAVTSDPDELLRIDPSTFEVTERSPLEGVDHASNVPATITADGSSVWVRVKDEVRELEPRR